MRKLFMLFSAFGMAALVGLGPLSCKPVRSSSKQKIVNGRALAEGSPVRSSTVAIGLLDANNLPVRAFCTGVLIATDAILTASSCLESASNLGTQKIGIIIDNPALAAPQGIPIKESSSLTETGTRDYPSFNLSLVRPASPILASQFYQPAEILRSPAGLQSSTKVLIAGYGRQNSKCLDAALCKGVLLEAESTIDSFQDQNHLLSTLLIRAQQDQGSICFGDAGGPAFVQVGTRYFLAGIATGSLRKSMSDLNPALSDGTVCENGLAAFTFPGDYISWLEKTKGIGLVPPSDGNLVRINLPAIENLALASKPSSTSSWGDWLSFSDYRDPAFATVSFLQQSLMNMEVLRKETPKIAEIDFFVKPKDAEIRVQTTSELRLTLPTIDGMPAKITSQLSSLEPLSAFKGLSKLTIDGMAILDFSPLSSLSNLLSLRIIRNGALSQSVSLALPDLKSLSDLNKMQSLELAQVVSLTLKEVDWSKLTALKTVVIDGMGQPLTVPVAPLMESLTIRNADLSDPKALIGLPASLSSLTITGSKLNSIDFISTLVNIKNLDVSGNQVKDFTRVVDLKKLSVLKAAGNAATNKICGTAIAANCEFDQLTNPQNIEEYCVNFVYQAADKARFMPIFGPLVQALKVTPKDLAVLPASGTDCADLYAKLRLKRKLDIVGTAFSAVPVDLSPIGTMNSLNSLSIKNLGLVDIAPLGKLINLDRLDLSQNAIVDVKALESLVELKNLNLASNQIVGMNGFTHKDLRSLTLDNNKLANVQSLGALPELRILSLADQPSLKDVKGLNKSPKLKQLNIGKTEVLDLQSLEPFVGLEIDASEEAFKAGCPSLLGSCVTGSGTTALAKSGPVPGLKPGKRIQGNPNPSIDMPGLAVPMKLE